MPNGEVLASDARCELRQGDFFALARDAFDAGEPGRRFDAVLLDIANATGWLRVRVTPRAETVPFTVLME